MHLPNQDVSHIGEQRKEDPPGLKAAAKYRGVSAAQAADHWRRRHLVAPKSSFFSAKNLHSFLLKTLHYIYIYKRTTFSRITNTPAKYILFSKCSVNL